MTWKIKEKLKKRPTLPRENPQRYSMTYSSKTKWEWDPERGEPEPSKSDCGCGLVIIFFILLWLFFPIWLLTKHPDSLSEPKSPIDYPESLPEPKLPTFDDLKRKCIPFSSYTISILEQGQHQNNGIDTFPRNCYDYVEGCESCSGLTFLKDDPHGFFRVASERNGFFTQCLYIMSSRNDADKYTYTLNLKLVDDIGKPVRFVGKPIPFDEFADVAPKDNCYSIQFDTFKRFFIDEKFEFHYNIAIYRVNETSNAGDADVAKITDPDHPDNTEEMLELLAELETDLPTYEDIKEQCVPFNSYTILKEGQNTWKNTVGYPKQCLVSGDCVYCSEVTFLHDIELYEGDQFFEFHIEENGVFTQCLYIIGKDAKDYTYSLNFGTNVTFTGTPIPFDEDQEVGKKYNCFSIPSDFWKIWYIDDELNFHYSITIHEKDVKTEVVKDSGDD